MISARICAAQSKLEFMEFIHGTTSIVGVPHGVESELSVTSDSPGTLVIEAAGREIKIVPVTTDGVSVKLSDLQQPLTQQGSAVKSILRTFNRLRGKPVGQHKPQRLYNFRAIFENGSPQNRGEVQATFDFHLLCETDFHWARVYHLELVHSKDGESTVTDRAEGTCPLCQEVRARLERDWHFES